jgi:hypothetical protein
MAALVAACSSAETSEPVPVDANAAVITVVFPSHRADTLDVIVTDPATIAAAESFVRTHTGPKLVSGRIVRGAGMDSRYPFHFIPESVKLVDAAMEICDGEPMRSTQALDLFFEWSTGDRSSASAPWCPWESQPIAVQRFGAA